MKHFDETGKTNHNSNWIYIPDHPYWIFIIRIPGSGKMYALLSLINHQPDTDKINLDVQNP